MSETDFVELERRLKVLGEAIGSDRYYEAAQADLDFHRYVWQCSGNEMLCRLLEPLIAALPSRAAERIRFEFERGATSSYAQYLDRERPAAEAFGFLSPPGR